MSKNKRSTMKSQTLASGPALPPVNHLGPASDGLERWQGNTMPLYGTEYKNVSPKSKLACIPTANHRLPVRRKVRHQNKPVSMTPAKPNLFSPGFVLCTSPNAMESSTAAGQKGMACARVNCTYPRKANSSYSPTIMKNAPQNAAQRSNSVP